MNRLLLFLICTLFLLASCKRNIPAIPENLISASVDGANESFNKNATASQASVAGTGNSLSISGTNAASENIFIQVISTGTVTRGTYPITISSQGGQPLTIMTVISHFFLI
ncbi:MAG: hypothetical protein JWP78_1703 [Mucilaginibacter sp.]|nr:hypothetical protein [Mucilaginibacter sp.]